MVEEVICTACPKHCVLGILAYKPCEAKSVEAPKDSIIPIQGIKPKVKDIRQYCQANYEG